MHVLGQDPDRGLDERLRSASSERLARERCRPDIPTAVRPRRGDGVHVGQPVGEAEAALREHGVLLVDGQRDRAATATAEEEAVRAVIGRPGRLPVRSDSTWSNRLSSCAVALLARDPATATYSATARTSRMTSVVPPLHSTRLRRTCSNHPAVGGLGGKLGSGGLGRDGSRQASARR